MREGFLMRFVKPVLVVAAIVLFVTSAHAAPLVTFSFHGTIFIGSGSPSVKGAFTNGDEVSGTYEFDPTDPGIFINGQKRQYFAIEDFTFDYGAFSAVHTGTNDSSITVGNNQFGVDTYRVDLDQGVSSAPFTVGLETFTLTRLFFELVDINESVFNSPALPSEPPDIGSFFSKNGSLVFQVSTSGFQSLSWVVDSLQKVAEPATLALFAFGLAGLGLVARKRVRT